jgi:propionyl-CoA carboxylase alpha chain
VAVHALAAALAGVRTRERDARVLRTIPRTWRNNPVPQEIAFRHGDDEVALTYAQRRDGRWDATVDGEPREVGILAWPDERSDGALVLDLDGRRLPIRLTERDGGWFVDSPLGATTLVEVPRFPVRGTEEVAGGLVAPMPGTVVEVLAAEGETVTAGQVLVLLEAMKMEHRIVAPADGTVSEVRVSAGDGVDADAVLVVVAET